MDQPKLKIIPLGGLQEVGRNCMVLEYDDSIVIIDVGLMFPEDDMLGVDLVIPDFTYLLENRDKVKGIVITHGHQDHIGALSYLLKEINVPVYGTALTLGLVAGALRPAPVRKNALLYAVKPGETFQLGPFKITPFHVNHSIPDSTGLAIRTPEGLIVHTGDFKIDHTPIEGKTTDLAALAKLSSEGVMVLFSDSTNAWSPGYTESESNLIDTFERVFDQAEGRIIVATFASLISRLQLVIETAVSHGRKIAVAGRSMEQNIAIAEELGYVKFPASARVALGEINNLPDDQICVLATGSQGEPNAALARMARGQFRHVHIRQGDTVLLSAKAIPGNETAIYRNIDNLFHLGANVVFGEKAGLHVSGHAAQEELKLILNLLQPLYFVPVHGSYAMRHTHARLAYALGFPREDVFVLDNGDCIELAEGKVELGEPIEIQDVLVDGSLVGDVGSTILRDRKALSQDGFVILRIDCDANTGELITEPEIISQGFVYVPESADLIAAAGEVVTAAVDSFPGNGNNLEEMGRFLKRRLERHFYAETGRRPVIIPLISGI